MIHLQKTRAFGPRVLLLSFTLFALLITSGCGTSLKEYYLGDLFSKSSSTTAQSPEQLAMDGMEAMQERNYKNAINSFQQLKERYPYSEYAILAELKLGDAHFYNKNHAEAAVAYEEFVRLHPRNEAVPYVLYQIGMCHFLEFNTVDRDQEETRLAMDAFRRLVQAYPDSEHARRAQKQIYECQKRLVAHEFQVGRFYFRNGEYASAKTRLDTIYRLYPEAITDLGYEEDIKDLLAKIEQEVAKGERKPSIWSRMGF